MDEEFEAAFEDELDALRDIEDDNEVSEPPGKSRRSLNFSTPSMKVVKPGRQTSLNDSCVLTPLESPCQKYGTEQDSLDESFSGPLLIDLDDEEEEQHKRKSQKRRKENVFGDLSDDDFAGENEILDKENENLPSLAPRRKRQRTTTPARSSNIDDNFEITPPPSPDRIRQMKYAQEKKSNQHVTLQDRLTKNYDFERKRILQRIPMGDFISVTGGEDSRRFYVRVQDEEQYEKKISAVSDGHKALALLGTPLAALRLQAEEESRQRILQQSQEITKDIKHSEHLASDSDSDTEADQPNPALWVERYAPRKYTQLLSDESTNRILLKWLKLWDYVVFNKEKPNKKMKEKKQEKNQFFNKKKAPDLTDELDEQHRPQYKVALLSGPPGLGKTTLAHVIAKHAGYNVVEMNASDDRSAEVFKTRIEAATQMKSVLGADPRPNCLVIDEIDGAPQPAIQMLLTMLKGPDPSKKKKKQPSHILRPIICICNDLYVPALRQLRQVALVINFPPTQNTKLASRLLEVSRIERVRTDMSTLIALCEKADNDIRSCINTLQFIKSQGQDLSLRNVTSLSLGQKDLHRSLFTVWQHIFQLPKAKRKSYVNPYDRGNSMSEIQDLEAAMSQDSTSSTTRFSSVLEMVHASGEYEKVAQGLYENYLQVKVKDPRMDCVQLANEWMCFNDMVTQQIQHSQDYILGRYTPYLPVAFHLLFAAKQPGRIIYPHSQFELATKTSKSNNLVTAMMNDMVPSVKKNLNVVVTVTEMLPPLMDIIQPTLRPVNTQLYSQREKEELKSLIKVMIAYNMTYHQERTPEGQYMYALDPNVDEVVKFPGVKSSKQSLTYAAKQLIAREIELEKMRRSEAALGTSARYSVPPGGSTGKQQVKDKPANAEKKEELPTHLRQKLQPIAPKSTEIKQEAVDFFGRKLSSRIVEAEGDATTKKESKREVIGGDIWFRFKEGYTNAVRKTVRVHDFL